MKLINTADPQFKPSVVMLVYGEGGVGKTTFASTAPNPILADCEGGSKYFGLRGIKIDVAMIERWSDMKDFLAIAQSNKYETVIIDPIGELMEKLRNFMVAQNDGKLVQKDGNPTMAGWGWLKNTMRAYLKVLRDSGKHVILVAHVDEGKDEDRVLKRPLIMTKISKDIANMVDVVGYFTVVAREGEEKRVIVVDPSSDKFVAKDRTGQLGKVIEPDFSKIIAACQGTETFAWSKKQEEARVAGGELIEKKAKPEKEEMPEDFLKSEVAEETAEKPLTNPHLQAAREKIRQVQDKQ